MNSSVYHLRVVVERGNPAAVNPARSKGRTRNLCGAELTKWDLNRKDFLKSAKGNFVQTANDNAVHCPKCLEILQLDSLTNKFNRILGGGR